MSPGAQSMGSCLQCHLWEHLSSPCSELAAKSTKKRPWVLSQALGHLPLPACKHQQDQPSPAGAWGFFCRLQQSRTNSYCSFSPATEIKYGVESQHSYSIESNATLSNTNNSKQMSQRLEHYGLSIPVCPDPWNSLKVTLRLARTLL